MCWSKQLKILPVENWLAGKCLVKFVAWVHLYQRQSCNFNQHKTNNATPFVKVLCLINVQREVVAIKLSVKHKCFKRISQVRQLTTFFHKKPGNNSENFQDSYCIVKACVWNENSNYHLHEIEMIWSRTKKSWSFFWRSGFFRILFCL